MNEMLTAIGGAIQAYAWQVFVGGSVFFALELALPASRFSLISRARAVVFWTAYILITASVVTLLVIAAIKVGIKPLISLDLGSLGREAGIVGWIVALVVVSLAADFLYYWFHRLQHATPFLWRFHKVHHSLREMSAVNSAHHFTEEIFRVPFVTVPLMLVDFGVGAAPVILATIFAVHAFFTHSSTRLHLGSLRYVIGDNRFHRVHHSLRPEHRDRNFGSFTSIWDQFFGTAVFPKRGEWPATGIDDVGEPASLRDYMWRPFKHG